MESMPADMRSARVRQQIDSLVEMDSWSDQVFELAHFTNREGSYPSTVGTPDV
jgi:hypothetical protein